MITTVYTCDRCGRAQVNERQHMYDVSIAVQEMTADRTYWRGPKVALWCGRCVQEYDLENMRRPKPEDPPPPTFEDAIRALVREEVDRQDSEKVG